MLGSDDELGGSTIFEVTHICMDRLQQVVVPIAAQHMRGRASWSSRLSVKCVAGQQIAKLTSKIQCSGMGKFPKQRSTLQSEQSNESWQWRIIYSPTFQKTGGELETLPTSQYRLYLVSALNTTSEMRHLPIGCTPHSQESISNRLVVVVARDTSSKVCQKLLEQQITVYLIRKETELGRVLLVVGARSRE